MTLNKGVLRFWLTACRQYWFPIHPLYMMSIFNISPYIKSVQFCTLVCNSVGMLYGSKIFSIPEPDPVPGKIRLIFLQNITFLLLMPSKQKNIQNFGNFP